MNFFILCSSNAFNETAAENGGADDNTTSESERRRKKNGVPRVRYPIALRRRSFKNIA
jgi:hypothetical protein